MSLSGGTSGPNHSFSPGATEVQEYRIGSVVDLLARLKELDSFQMFRGQARADWSLLPAIGRMHSVACEYGGWHALEELLIERFQKYSRPFMTKEPDNKLEWLVVAQHYGLPTRLLDWTTNPLKALFFAVENPGLAEEGILWALEPKEWWNQLTDIDRKLDESGILVAYSPDYLNQRVSSQESCFAVFPFPEDRSEILPLDRGILYEPHIRRLAKFIVPADCKALVCQELHKLGITHRSMFPGLDGLAKSIRRELGLAW